MGERPAYISCQISFTEYVRISLRPFRPELDGIPDPAVQRRSARLESRRVDRHGSLPCNRIDLYRILRANWRLSAIW